MSVRVACQEQRASRLLPQILRACLFVAVAQFLLVANSNWRCTMLCTSGFVDDVVFSITRPVRQATQVGCSLKVTRQGAAPICHRDVYSNRLTRGQHRTRRGGVWYLLLRSCWRDDVVQNTTRRRWRLRCSASCSSASPSPASTSTPVNSFRPRSATSASARRPRVLASAAWRQLTSADHWLASWLLFLCRPPYGRGHKAMLRSVCLSFFILPIR